MNPKQHDYERAIDIRALRAEARAKWIASIQKRHNKRR